MSGFKAKINGDFMGNRTVPMILFDGIPLLYSEEVSEFKKWLSAAKKWIDWRGKTEGGGGDMKKPKKTRKPDQIEQAIINCHKICEDSRRHSFRYRCWKQTDEN